MLFGKCRWDGVAGRHDGVRGLHEVDIVSKYLLVGHKPPCEEEICWDDPEADKIEESLGLENWLPRHKSCRDTIKDEVHEGRSKDKVALKRHRGIGDQSKDQQGREVRSKHGNLKLWVVVDFNEFVDCSCRCVMRIRFEITLVYQFLDSLLQC